MIIKKFLPILTLLVLSVITILPLSRSGYFTIHDDQQVVRLFELDKTLQSGVFPARWVPDLGFGYGYALFNFYPPLVYYLGEIFHLLGASFLDSTKIVWGVALVGSALAMYALAKEFFGKIGGLVSAVFYLYAPYHAVDAYVRGALAELFSFVWLPLILLFSYKKKHLLTALVLAALMLTHNLIFLPFIGFYLLWSRNFRSLLLALALTAFFWLPSLAEKQFTLVDQFLTTSLASYQIHFVCPEQLWNSLWGYGGSVVGCLDGISFKVGKPHIVLVFVALAILLWRRSRLLLTLVFFFFASLFMTTEYSRPIWDNIQSLWYLQFPWRFLEFATLFSSVLAGAFVLVVKRTHWQLLLAATLIVSVIFLHGKYFFPVGFLPGASNATLLTDDEIKWRVSQTSFEYMPKGIAVWPTPQGSYILDIPTYPRQKFQVISGDFQTKTSDFTTAAFVVTGISTQGAKVQFSITDFPGWVLWVDGIKTPIDNSNSLKLITVTLAPGEHQITGRFTNTPVRTAGNTISLLTIMGLAGGMIYARRRHKT